MMHSTCPPISPASAARSGRKAVAIGLVPVDVDRYLGNHEPDLEDLITDEVMGRVMARDGVRPDDVRALLDCMRNKVR